MQDDKDKQVANDTAAQEDAELDTLLDSLQQPMTQDEAEHAFAELDVKKMQLNVIRQKWLTQIAQLQMQVSDLDTQLIALDLNKAVVFRRTLNQIPVK